MKKTRIRQYQLVGIGLCSVIFLFGCDFKFGYFVLSYRCNFVWTQGCVCACVFNFIIFGFLCIKSQYLWVHSISTHQQCQIGLDHEPTKKGSAECKQCVSLMKASKLCNLVKWDSSTKLSDPTKCVCVFGLMQEAIFPLKALSQGEINDLWWKQNVWKQPRKVWK